MRTIRRFGEFLPTKLVLYIDHFRAYGKILDLKDPKYFGEKIQWIKLYGQVERFTPLVDKYLVRKHIEKKIGKEYLPELYKVYKNVDEIDYDELPERFVLKLNSGSGANIICKDKSLLDRELTNKKIRKMMKEKYYKCTKEPQYKNINKMIICEEYLENSKGFLTEYKLHCFDGKVKFIEVHEERFNGNRESYYYPDWSRTEFSPKWVNNNENYKEKPKYLEELIKLGETLAEGFTYVRVDINSTDEKLYFSELTFTPASGMNAFYPLEKDLEIASMIDLKKY